MADVGTYLFFPPTSPAHRSTSSATTSAEYSVWIWMTLGLVGYKLCISAMELYTFCEVWNRISNAHHVDISVIRLSKEHIEERHIRINQALTTRPFKSTVGTQATRINSDNSTTGHDDNNKSSTAITSTTNRGRECPNGDDCPSSQSSQEKTCPICLNDFEEGDIVSSTSSSDPAACSHCFHDKCLRTWLSKSSSCPVCRFQMLHHPSPTSTAITPTQILITESSNYFSWLTIIDPQQA